MKQPKKLTRNHKIILSKKGYDPKNMSLVSETKHTMIVMDKTTMTQHCISLDDVSIGSRNGRSAKHG